MMPSMDLAAVAAVLDASYSGAPRTLRRLVVDSRQVGTDDLFVAVRGEHQDGHDFVDAAAAAGAAAAIVERDMQAAIPTLKVADSLAALSLVGQRNREAYDGELLAITGSCGKTSVKNLCRCIFERAGSTVATAGNYNNEIGVPLTLSRLDGETRFAVVEMGAARRGDIAHLCTLASPRVATVLNAMEAHLDGFGTVADVADIKAEIYDGLGPDGIGIVNADQPWAAMWQARIEARGATVISYSVDGDADLTVDAVEDLGLSGLRFVLQHGREQQYVGLALPGRHNLSNALAAASLAVACGVSLDLIAEGLGSARAEPGRLRVETLAHNTSLIDDSYNANPGSVRAAIRLLAGTPGRRLLVLGEMRELGEGSARFHREMGELAAAQGIDAFIGVGEALAPAVEAFGRGARLFADRDALQPLLSSLLDAADVILVKGSRGAAMEAVLQDLRQASEDAA